MRNKPSLERKVLSSFWQDSLNRKMEKNYSDIIGSWCLVSSWKVDGWNDGTTTLHGVYKSGDVFVMYSFPDYGEPSKSHVKPVFEHTGWEQHEG